MKIETKLANALAEIQIQNEMIDGARRAAARLMCQNTNMRTALDRIRLRERTHTYREAFEMCKLIAHETVKDLEKIKI